MQPATYDFVALYKYRTDRSKNTFHWRKSTRFFVDNIGEHPHIVVHSLLRSSRWLWVDSNMQDLIVFYKEADYGMVAALDRTNLRLNKDEIPNTIVWLVKNGYTPLRTSFNMPYFADWVGLPKDMTSEEADLDQNRILDRQLKAQQVNANTEGS